MEKTQPAWLCLILLVLLAAGAAVALAGFAGSEVYVASVGHGTGVGGSQWRTTLWVHNPGPEPANCQLQLLLRNQANPSPASYFVAVAPGETLRFDDATWLLFGVEGYGALRVLSDVDVVVNSRIYNQPGSDISDTQGQFFSAMPASFAIGLGQTTDVLGINQAADEAFRFNWGLVETTGNAVTVMLTLFGQDGGELARTSYDLEGFEPIQVGVADLGAGQHPTGNGRLQVEVTAGSGRVIAFGSGIANQSQDPSTFEMTLHSEGGTSGDGDITAVHAGTGLDGGGESGEVTLGIAEAGVTSDRLADAAVTEDKLADLAVTEDKLAALAVSADKIISGAVNQTKLSATGAAAGQVLGTDGDELAWVDAAGFSLPYEGSVSGNTPGFAVTAEDHDALHGTTNGENTYGVYGRAWGEGGVGVTGFSQENVGVLGSTAGRYAVHGANFGTMNWGYIGGTWEGVYGENSSGEWGILGSTNAGVWGRHGDEGCSGALGLQDKGAFAYGVEYEAQGALGHDGYFGAGVWGSDGTSGRWAGHFRGDVFVSGVIDNGKSMDVVMDHPEDPLGRYLRQSAIVAPDRLTMIRGTVSLDDDGEAWVEAPSWFEATASDLSYHLTPIGAPMPDLHVASRLADGRFKVAGGAASMEVSWQITGTRADPWAQDHPLAVEAPKSEDEAGAYLYPQGWGADDSLLMERLQDQPLPLTPRPSRPNVVP